MFDFSLFINFLSGAQEGLRLSDLNILSNLYLSKSEIEHPKSEFEHPKSEINYEFIEIRNSSFVLVPLIWDCKNSIASCEFISAR